MPSPTIRSGHAECQSSAVTNPAPIMARLAKASFRAERKAARVRLPPECRCFASRNAQNRFTASAPAPVRVSETGAGGTGTLNFDHRSEEHTSELQSLMRISYAVFCLKKKITTIKNTTV